MQVESVLARFWTLRVKHLKVQASVRSSADCEQLQGNANNDDDDDDDEKVLDGRMEGGW